ncbi:MAG: MarR family transcriptional regulator [Actinomycetes bacterium]
MPAARKTPTDPPVGDDLAALADLADLVLNVARLIRARTPTPPDAVALSETERHVMRLVDLHPGCTPSNIAARGRLQRSNVSAALNSLEGKGMIARTANGDRTVTVEPTQLAADNLALLRAAWAGELAEALQDDLSTVRRCAKLLSRLETQLNGDTYDHMQEGTNT